VVRIAIVGSGRGVYALDWAATLAARGHEVRFVTLGEVLTAPGVEVRTRPIPRSLSQAVRAGRGFVRDIRSFKPDVLHLNYAGGRLGTLATLASVHPLVAAVVGGDVLPEQHSRGHPWLERRATRRILELADLILVKNDVLCRAVAALGDFAGKVEMVRWGVDPARFHRDPEAGDSLRRRLGLVAEDRVVLSPRLLQPLYNVHLILEAMPRILAAAPRAVLLVTEYNASRDYRRLLEERAARLALGDRLRFVGRIDHEQMPALYSLAEVVVSVPASDGLPQTLFEAMACGVPVVLGRLPGYGDVVVDGESALFTDFEPGAIANAVLRLLGEPALAQALARNALEQVQQVAFLPKEVERVEGLYRTLAAGGAGRRIHGGWLFDALGLLLRRRPPE
jgi:glycosyltransferase involved in cell wall biosynthesis